MSSMDAVPASVTNLKTRIEVLLEAELEAWEAGQKQWTVSNQHDPYVIESALEGIKAGALEAWITKHPDANHDGMSLMTWAHALAEWEAPELDPGWTD